MCGFGGEQRRAAGKRRSYIEHHQAAARMLFVWSAVELLLERLDRNACSETDP